MKKRSIIFIFCLLAGFSISCKKPKDDKTNPITSFDKSGMLANIGDNIIIPSYNELKSKADSLHKKHLFFINNPDVNSLSVLQSAFVDAYLAYQSVSVFEFGPADKELIRANFNTFPCDTLQILNKINSGDYNLSTVADMDAKGFPALDYLLFGSSNDQQKVLSYFTNNTNAKTYLTALVNDIKTKSETVYTAWISSGENYIGSFKSNTASNVGSPIGMLINQLNYDFEMAKNAKIGIPLGKKSMGTIYPEKVEAYYSKQSLNLVKAQLASIENIYTGNSKFNSNGLGIDDYVIAVKAQHPMGELNSVIINQFASIKSKVSNIPETLANSIKSNPTMIDEAYAEMVKLVVLLKVDMTSSLGVMITYEDNDGD